MSSKELNHSPVSLPAGSYDVQKLRKGLDHAAELKDRDKGVDKALTDARSRETAVRDPGARPDQKRMTVARDDLGEGVEEHVLVHDAKSDAAEESAERADEDAARLEAQARVRAERGAAPSGNEGE